MNFALLLKTSNKDIERVLTCTCVNHFCHCTGLEISFEQPQYSIREGETLSPVMRLQFRETQNPFTVTFYPVSITTAKTEFEVGDFIMSSVIDEATAGELGFSQFELVKCTTCIIGYHIFIRCTIA